MQKLSLNFTFSSCGVLAYKAKMCKKENGKYLGLKKTPEKNGFVAWEEFNRVELRPFADCVFLLKQIILFSDSGHAYIRVRIN